MYYNKYIFYKYYHDSKKNYNLFFKSKYSFLNEFFNDIKKFNELKAEKE